MFLYSGVHEQIVAILFDYPSHPEVNVFLHRAPQRYHTDGTVDDIL
jgi:hypothetical protein